MTNQKDNISYHGCQCTHPSRALRARNHACVLRHELTEEGCYLQSHDTTKYMRSRIILQYQPMILPFCNALQFFWADFINDTAKQGIMQRETSTSYLLECSPYQSQSILSSPLPNFYWQKLCGGRNRINLRLMPCIFNILLVANSVKFSRLYYSIGLSTTCELFSSKGV